MGCSHPDRRTPYTVLLALGLALAGGGCGGGGGSGGSSSSGGNPPAPPPVNYGFTVSAASITQAASVAGDEPLNSSLTVTVTDTVRGEHGIRATYTSTGIAIATRMTMSTVTTDISIGFKSPHTVTPGVYQDTVRIGLCDDAACSVFRGTALEIPVTYTVTVGTMPTVAPATTSVTVSRLPWDFFTPTPVRVTVTPTPRTRYFLNATATHSTNAISSATYGQDIAESGYVQIAFKPATQLTPGVHTDTITLSACIDQACAFPLVVSPAVITVTYNVTATVPGPQGYSVRRSSQAIADISWSTARNALYAVVPTGASNYPGSLIVLDPVTEAVSSSVTIGFDPSLLAVAGDESALYVAERNGDAIRRFTTSPLAAGSLISLGLDPYPPGTDELFAADMRVAPGQPQVLAVRRNVNLSGREGAGIVIYDGTVRRPEVAQISPFSDWGNIVWGPNGTLLYSQRATLTVTANGPVFASNLPGMYGRLHFANGILYADEAQVVDPAAGTFSFFSTTGRARALAVDVAKNRAYFVTLAFTNEMPYIEIFNLLTKARIGEALLPPFAANVRPTRVVRFGTDGLAVVNSANELYLVQGALIQ